MQALPTARSTRLSRGPLVAISLLLLTACGSVPLNEAGEFDPRSTQSFALDNDTFADSDDDYTNGLQYSWLSPYLDSYEEAPIPSAVGRWLDEWQIFNRAEEQQHFFSYSFSHRIFTPSDLTLENPVDGADVPYSASMYLTATAGAQNASTMDAVSATIGWVGPAALGEQIQNGWHDLISSKDAEGWDTQIGNEPLFNLAYERRWRLSSFGHRGWGGDWLASGAGSLGNLLSMATAGTSVRFGWNVLDDYAMPPPFASEESIGSRPLTRTGIPQWSIYGFLYVSGSVIANAIFWDGNTFSDSPSVDYDPFIARAYTGLVVRRGGLSVAFTLVDTTVPWEDPEDPSTQRYGRLGFTWTL